MIFDHERLDVYRVSIELVAWAGALFEGPLAGKRQAAMGQLDRASTSVALNIAEGNGKRSVKADAGKPAPPALSRPGFPR